MFSKELVEGPVAGQVMLLLSVTQNPFETAHIIFVQYNYTYVADDRALTPPNSSDFIGSKFKETLAHPPTLAWLSSVHAACERCSNHKSIDLSVTHEWQLIEKGMQQS